MSQATEEAWKERGMCELCGACPVCTEDVGSLGVKHAEGCTAEGKIPPCPNRATRIVENNGWPLRVCERHYQKAPPSLRPCQPWNTPG